ncbi:hypothetical protein HU200_031945 [Digitaria exilis]|uniref:peptidylprolyl isomerase n=1 Tax=Digitaria exilis TaxID=1010633 RepID=A0A835BXY0_9POAL|nr:hypothetical protein HU200_031945 [Digitaria exilis]
MAEAIDLSGDGGVLKTVVRKAKDDAIAPSDSLPLVDVHYEGTLAENGGAVIKAWDMALRTMKVGEVAKIICKPEYAYGAAGSPPELPPKSVSFILLQLLDWELKKQRELAAATKEEEKKKREEAKAAAAARVQAKLDAKKGKGKGKGK